MLMGQRGEARENEPIFLIVDPNQIFQKGLPKDLVDSILKTFHSRGINHGSALMMEFKGNLGIGNGIVHHLPTQVAEFRGVCFQKLASSRNIKKKILHLNLCPYRPGDFLYPTQLSSL